MRVEKLCIRRRVAILDVRRRLSLREHIGQALAPDDFAFAKLTFAAGREICAPEFLRELLHFRVALRKIFHARRLRRRLAHDRCPGFHEVADFPQHSRAHRVQLRQHQHAVAHAVRQDEHSIFHREIFLDDLGVDVVEVAARRQFGIAHTGHLRRVFADEVSHIRRAPALLQQPAAAALVIHPRLALLIPSVVPVELRAPRCVDARKFIFIGLLNDNVQHNMIDSFAERPVATRLQIAR